MTSKVKAYISVGCVAIIFVAIALGIGLSGIKNGGHNFVQIEINPKIEFISDKKDKVISAVPRNLEAKELIAGENFIGLHLKDACKKFVDLAARANYIDVSKKGGAILLTVVSDLTSNLEVKTHKAISEYLKKNEINAIILESENILDIYKNAKILNCSNDKYVLLKSAENFSEKTAEQLKKLSQKDLINIVKQGHEKYNNEVKFTSLNYSNKEKLIEKNSEKFKDHISKITNKSQREFAEKYENFVLKNISYYNTHYYKILNGYKEK